jgi:hypothetical protein
VGEDEAVIHAMQGVAVGAVLAHANSVTGAAPTDEECGRGSGGRRGEHQEQRGEHADQRSSAANGAV